MVTKDSFDRQTQHVLLNFISLRPSDLNLSQETFKNAGLTVFKRKNKVMMYRFSPTPSSTLDYVDDPNNEDSMPSEDEIQAAHHYVDIRDEQDGEFVQLSKEINSIQKELQEEIKKNESVVVDKNKNATVMFDSPNSKPPGASTQASDPITSVEQNVGMRLRVVADQLEQGYQEQFNRAAEELIQVLNIESSRFEVAFNDIVQRLESITETGWQAVAIICTLCQRLVLACVSSFELVVNVASRIISQRQRSYIEKHGGWENNLSIELVESSTDPPNNNNINNS